MIIKVKLRFLKIAPRKVRLLADLIRGQMTRFAIDQLTLCRQQAAGPLIKAIKSALTQAKEKDMEDKDLYIKSILVDEGPKLVRRRLLSRGRTTSVKKQSSHITLVLSQRMEK